MNDAELFILDFDGTLVRLVTPWLELKKTLSLECLKNKIAWDDELGLDHNLRRIRLSHGEHLFSALCTKVEIAEISALKNYELNYGLIEKIKSRPDTLIAIFSSNTVGCIQAFLRTQPLQFLNCRMIVGKQSVVHGKPHCEGIRLILDKLGVLPTKAIMIGDSRLDFEAAAAFDIRFMDVAQISHWGRWPLNYE